ncbi:hypothetical protein 20Sep420_00052 [Pseudomonas phage 20Sep420]|nr:hypothetical protein 20Sep420_00052 [Pseudomonas phage 20Sep420]
MLVLYLLILFYISLYIKFFKINHLKSNLLTKFQQIFSKISSYCIEPIFEPLNTDTHGWIFGR